MVGGEGRRLRPLTESKPKSLLQVGSRSILEHTLLLLREHGILDVTLAVNYLAWMIEDAFEDGRRLGMRIRYLHEPKPLGTAGALSELADFSETTLMMNGDILTDIDLSAMRDFHKNEGAVMTVASKTMYTHLSLGVLDVDGAGLITGYREKPRLEHRFGIGMYVVDPIVKRYMTAGEPLDVPELINRLISDGQKVSAYDHPGKWVDIGLPEDYARVQEALRPAEFARAGA
jgi:NDP-sugar pyrophosphorylase family protein